MVEILCNVQVINIQFVVFSSVQVQEPGTSCDVHFSLNSRQQEMRDTFKIFD